MMTSDHPPLATTPQIVAFEFTSMIGSASPDSSAFRY